MATRKTTNDPLDPAALDTIAAETAALLAEAPPPLREAADEVAEEAAAHYTPTDEPEDLSQLLGQAFAALGRDVPSELLQAMRAKQQPIVADPHGQPTTNDAEEERRRQERVENRYRAALDRVSGRGSEKRENYLAALRQSPPIAFFNRKDRYLLINRVAVEVPEGMVTIPIMIAREIEGIDATEQWAERARREAERMSDIDRPTSFIEKRVHALSIR